MKKFIFYFCLCWGVITIVGCNKDDDLTVLITIQT